MPRYHRLLQPALILLLGALWLPGVSWAYDPSALQTEIQRLLNETEGCLPVSHAGPARLDTFYSDRDFDAVWVDTNGLKPAAQAFLTALKNAAQEGLDPGDYPLGDLETELAELLYQAGSQSEVSPQRAAALEIGLSRTALTFGRHLAQGRISPEKTGQSWFGPRHAESWEPLLSRMVTATTAAEITSAAAPADAVYRDLRDALQRYRTIADQGGWTPIRSDRTLQLGMRAEVVMHLRRRLEATGDILPEVNRIAANSMQSDRFDAALAHSVAAFQARHGLDTDGKVGRQTLAALNLPVGRRIDTLRANMERRRWAPRDLGTRHLRVNIPAFELEAVSAGRVVSHMRVIVGRPKRPTPVLSGDMTYLELNPYWHVPPRIAQKDILPKVQADPDYLLSQGFRVFSDWTAQAHELDPREIDWRQLSGRGFPYKLRQDPAAVNALGEVKFMFPNEHSIYLHDTPAKGLFEKQRRSFSSGCVRVAEPRELAALLLSDRPRWDAQRLAEAFDARTPRVVRLGTPMPVHLQYWTAWVDAAGRVHFREDIYQRDRDLLRALDHRHLRLASCPPAAVPDTMGAAAAPAVAVPQQST